MGFKVNDRRGVEDEPKKPEATTKAVPVAEKEKADAPVSESGGGMPEISFGSFVLSFATQALMQLGDIPPPPGVSVPQDPIAAKQMIDILGMLEKKTKGNLSEDETKLLSDVLHSLRLSYVKHSTSK